ncbi:retrovirus-related pol polyprotein from transposon TNT 1-94 [Tanacetum coccineum]
MVRGFVLVIIKKDIQLINVLKRLDILIGTKERRLRNKEEWCFVDCRSCDHFSGDLLLIEYWRRMECINEGDLSTNQVVTVGKGSRCLYICKPIVDPIAFIASISDLHKSHLNYVPSTSLSKESFSNSVSKNVPLRDKLRLQRTSVLGHVQSKHDYTLFVKAQGEIFTAVLVYVDDMLLTGNSQSEILSLKNSLDKKFTIKDLGLAKYFLGIELCKTDTGMHLNQSKYILDLLTDAGLTENPPSLGIIRYFVSFLQNLFLVLSVKGLRQIF